MVDAATIQTIILYLALGFVIVTNRLGGPQEAYYRIFRKLYFIDYFRGPDKRYRRRLFPMTDIKTDGGMARHHYGIGDYELPEGEASVSASGAPLWFHDYKEFRAIPQYMDEINDNGKIGKEWRGKIPPDVVSAAFDSHTIRDIHDDSKPKPQQGLGWVTITLLAVAIIVMVFVAYYSWNTACAVHSNICPPQSTTTTTVTGH